jgi:hypothetical protein
MDHQAFAVGASSNPKDFDQLSLGDKAYFISSMFGLFKYYELMFLEYKDGNTDEVSWNSWSRHMLMQFHQPGVRAWWALREEPI